MSFHLVSSILTPAILYFMPYKDPIKQREAQRRWYLDNKGSQQKASSLWKRNTRKLIKKFVFDAKDQPCTDCGKDFPSYVMDFDHVRGPKVGSISSLVSKCDLSKIEAEIAKCEIVCANCHRERTWGPNKRPLLPRG